jgi:hypothetical protein
MNPQQTLTAKSDPADGSVGGQRDLLSVVGRERRWRAAPTRVAQPERPFRNLRGGIVEESRIRSAKILEGSGDESRFV